jgi:hypothetical protein
MPSPPDLSAPDGRFYAETMPALPQKRESLRAQTTNAIGLIHPFLHHGRHESFPAGEEDGIASKYPTGNDSTHKGVRTPV